MKRRSKSPPEAMPFRRGRAPVPSAAPPVRIDWISTAAWSAFLAEATDAHRLASGSGVWLERFGPDLLLSYQHERSRDAVLAEIDPRSAAYAFQPRRIFGKYLPQQASERGAPVLLRGDAALPLKTEIREADIRYGLDFAAGYSAGFFIDQRANRARLRDYRPRRLLNTFAYTCSFSVVAALAGAETVSVDLSKRSLTRGEENFRRNGIETTSAPRFIADDVLAVFPRLARCGEKFDVIILDPPTFSRNQAGAAFQVQRDFDRLILLALEVAAPAAKILLSVNHSEMRNSDLEHAARSALKMHGRSGRFSSTAALIDFPPGQGAKTVWLEMNS